MDKIQIQICLLHLNVQTFFLVMMSDNIIIYSALVDHVECQSLLEHYFICLIIAEV